MKKVMGLILGFVPVSVSAECVPVPDCASIGYTETSCDGDSLKCPFDISKLYCVPCDSSFKYSCTGEGMIGAIGDVCAEKYVTCKCDTSAGYHFDNGICVCDDSCDVIGNIYYSDGTCSSCVLEDKVAVGIVAYKGNDKHLIMGLETVSMTWSATQTDAEGNVIIEQNVDLSGLVNNVNPDYNGAENTQIIVEAYGENATGVAAVYCYNYKPDGFEESKNKWYLPANNELHEIIAPNRDKINVGIRRLGAAELAWSSTWSSTERNQYQSTYYHASSMYVHEKSVAKYVRCFYGL